MTDSKHIPAEPMLELDQQETAQVQGGAVFVGGWGSSMYQYAYNDTSF